MRKHYYESVLLYAFVVYSTPFKLSSFPSSAFGSTIFCDESDVASEKHENMFSKEMHKEAII